MRNAPAWDPSSLTVVPVPGLPDRALPNAANEAGHPLSAVGRVVSKVCRAGARPPPLSELAARPGQAPALREPAPGPTRHSRSETTVSETLVRTLALPRIAAAIRTPLCAASRVGWRVLLRVSAQPVHRCDLNFDNEREFYSWRYVPVLRERDVDSGSRTPVTRASSSTSARRSCGFPHSRSATRRLDARADGAPRDRRWLQLPGAAGPAITSLPLALGGLFLTHACSAPGVAPR